MKAFDPRGSVFNFVELKDDHEGTARTLLAQLEGISPNG